MNPHARAIMATASGGAPAGPSLPIDWATVLAGSFARASAATHWDGTTFNRYTSGTARILGDGSLYVEGARTNYVTQSVIDASYTNNGTALTLNASTSPDTTTTAANITNIAGNGRFHTLGAGVPSSGTMTASAFLKRASASGTIKLGLNLFSPVTDVAVAFGAAWGRAAAQITRSGSGFYTFRINDQLCSIWGTQGEVGAFGSQLIETAGAVGTRLADDAYIASADVPAAMRSGSFSVVITPRRASTQANDTSTGTLLAFGTGTDNRIYIDAANAVNVRQGAATKVASGALTWSADQAITLTFNAATGALTVAGATTGNGTTTTTAWTMPTGDVQVGNDDALGTAFFGRISPPVAP